MKRLAHLVCIAALVGCATTASVPPPQPPPQPPVPAPPPKVKAPEPPTISIGCDSDEDLLLGMLVDGQFYMALIGHCDARGRGVIGPRPRGIGT